MWQLSRQNISSQTIGRIFFDLRYLPFEKKTGSCQIRTQDFCPPRRIRYHKAKLRDTKQIEFILKQGTSRVQ